MAVRALHVRYRGRTYSNPKQGFAMLGKTLKKNFEGSARAVKADMASYVNRVIEAMIERHSGKWPGGTSGNTLSRRSGALLEQIRSSGSVTGSQYDSMRATFRLTGEMLIHELGGEIKGQGKMLTIPLPAALNANGVPLKRSARDWANTFVSETKAGNLIIFQRRGGRKIVPLYLLRDTAYIPARLGYRKEVEEQLPYFVTKAADDIINRMTRK